MRKLALCSAIAVLSGSCVTNDVNTDSIDLTKFSQIDATIAKTVVVRGYISQTHGAAGLYLNRQDLLRENDQCILLVPFSGYRHGQPVKIVGKIHRTDCGGESICTNVCDRYELVAVEAR